MSNYLSKSPLAPLWQRGVGGLYSEKYYIFGLGKPSRALSAKAISSWGIS